MHHINKKDLDATSTKDCLTRAETIYCQPFVESHFIIYCFLTNGIYGKHSRENGWPKGWLQIMSIWSVIMTYALRFA